MNITQHSTHKANGIMGCIKNGAVERLRTVTLAISTDEATSGLLLWAFQHYHRMEILGRVQRSEVHHKHKETFFNV